MRIPPEALISREKLTDYLLKFRESDDKSRFLARAGFSAENPEDLLGAIRNIAAGHEAVVDRVNRFGEFYRLDGSLLGPNGRGLAVTTIWLKDLDGRVKYVTLKPRREET